MDSNQAADPLIGKDCTVAGQVWNVREQAKWSEQYYILTRAATDADGKVIPARWDMIIRPKQVIMQHLTHVEGEPWQG